MDKKYIILAVAAVIVIGIFFYFQSAPTPVPKDMREETGGMMEKETMMKDMPVSGSVDDAVEAILQDGSIQDETPSAEIDPTLVNEADQNISGFGQSLDINQF